MNEITAIGILILCFAILLIPIIFLVVRFFRAFMHKTTKNEINNHTKNIVLTQDQCLNEIRNDIHNIYKIANFFYVLTFTSLCIFVIYIVILVLSFISSIVG